MMLEELGLKVANVWTKESFGAGGHYSGDLFIGIFRDKGDLEETLYMDEDFNTLSKHWINTERFGAFHEKNINLTDSSILKELFNKKKYEDELVQFIVKKSKDFIDKHEAFVSSHLD